MGGCTGNRTLIHQVWNSAPIVLGVICNERALTSCSASFLLRFVSHFVIQRYA